MRLLGTCSKASNTCGTIQCLTNARLPAQPTLHYGAHNLLSHSDNTPIKRTTTPQHKPSTRGMNSTARQHRKTRIVINNTSTANSSAITVVNVTKAIYAGIENAFFVSTATQKDTKKRTAHVHVTTTTPGILDIHRQVHRS